MTPAHFPSLPPSSEESRMKACMQSLMYMERTPAKDIQAAPYRYAASVQLSFIVTARTGLCWEANHDRTNHRRKD
jgi:hypothetical protein